MNKKMIITNGLALFAMFFGAGNIIYPLALGVEAGNHIVYVIAAFLISGIGLPFLGLFATSLYQGNYWAFFNRLGTLPAFLVISFLILIIGPLFGAPRTATVAYHTLQPFLPEKLNSPYLFSGFYCAILFLMTYHHTKIVDIIGRILSPIKLILFLTLIVAGLLGSHTIIESKLTLTSSIRLGLVDGYSTMDLIAAIFFCSVICQSIFTKTKACGITSSRTIIKIFLLSCLVGGVLLGIVYIGFMLVALCHASELQGVETAQMIIAISNVVLGQFGSLFVGICVSFACLVTAIALTEITTEFLFEKVARKKLPRSLCLITTILFIYAMSIVGFAGIMKMALPILEVLYPTLILYCMINIGFKVFKAKVRIQDNKLASSFASQ